MKKILKILAIILAVFVSAIVVISLWVNFSSAPVYPTKSIRYSVQPDSASIQRGANLVKHICATCHMGTDGKLSGQLISSKEDAFGEIWAKNITKHPTFGIGIYTDEDLYYLLRTGIKNDGHFAGPYMTKGMLSDEDLVSIVKFLRSDDLLVAPSNKKHPLPKYSFLAKALEKFGMLVPEEYLDEEIPTPSADNTIEFGRYLATAVYECYNCHSKSFSTNSIIEPEKSIGYFGGGTPIGLPSMGVIVSPNITMHPKTGIGKYSEEEFSNITRFGIRPDQSRMSSLMPKFSGLSDNEIHAIWEYLKTVPILE